MHERIEPISRVACVALGLLLVFQLVRGLARPNPLRNLRTPAVPTLSATPPDSELPGNAPNARPGAAAAPPGIQPSSQTTNSPTGRVAIAAGPQVASKATNAPAGESLLERYP